MHGSSVGYWEENGFKSGQAHYRHGHKVRFTFWNFDGTVSWQLYDVVKNGKRVTERSKSSPPWWWDVEDQTEPTAPW